jgi:two-component system response regulator LytT
MRIVIIEDERITADDLVLTLKRVDPNLEVAAILRSVAEGISWFESNLAPELIFSDIQLGDGLSFEILNNLQVPVIFCTAFDEYALNAFKANGIDYLLKPFTVASVSAALSKYKNLTAPKADDITKQYEAIRHILKEAKPAKVASILIRHRDTIFPLKIEDIAFFRVDNTLVRALTFEETTYYPAKTLEELESMVGEGFYRVNRQYLINRKAIINASSLFSRKLSISLNVPVDEPITISKEKSTAFFAWLSGSSI